MTLITLVCSQFFGLLSVLIWCIIPSRIVSVVDKPKVIELSDQGSALDSHVSSKLPEAEPEPTRCRWCGKKEIIEGYHTCPNCHRVQHSILGKLQVINAAGWLAVVVAMLAVAISLVQVTTSQEQNALTRAQVEQARQERQLAEDAVVAADSAAETATAAVRGAERARASVENALSEAKQARDDANEARSSAGHALNNVEQIRIRIEQEAAGVRDLLIAQVASDAEAALAGVQSCLDKLSEKTRELQEKAGSEHPFVITPDPVAPDKESDLLISNNCYYDVGSLISRMEKSAHTIANFKEKVSDLSRLTNVFCRMYSAFDNDSIAFIFSDMTLFSNEITEPLEHLRKKSFFEVALESCSYDDLFEHFYNLKTD